MPVAHLEDRAILAVSGAEAEHFLQNLITADLSTLKDGETRSAALLSPQGKILFDFLVSRADEGAFRLECRADVADDFLRRLMLYRLRAKVEIAKTPPSSVAVIWAPEGKLSAERQGLTDSRFGGTVQRRYDQPLPPADATEGDWNAYRIASGIAEGGSDYALGDAFPHDVLLDQVDGIGFQKGCYVGQEVVSRMQHRGTARRRVLIVRGEASLPAPGTEITAGGRTVGTLGSVSGNDGLAIVRIDRVKDAMDIGEPIMARDVPVALSIPEWAKFTYPQPADAGTSNA
ncbi:MAG: folate-binding protein YgfZ [Hyphomicrobiales bacterium]|nr:folate-binding protein YgfZ [Hyphomicrobiales bacterium]